MKKKFAVMAIAGAALCMAAMPACAAEDLITVGYAQVGHESDWRTANTQNYQDVFSEEAGYSLIQLLGIVMPQGIILHNSATYTLAYITIYVNTFLFRAK